MKAILIVVALLLAGCADRVSGWMLEQAVEFCRDRKGISYIDVESAWEGLAVCNTGEMRKLRTYNKAL